MVISLSSTLSEMARSIQGDSRFVQEAEMTLVRARRNRLLAERPLPDDGEPAQLPPLVTMRGDAPPLDRNRRGSPEEQALGKRQIVARRRFDAAAAAVGPGL